MVKQKDTKHLHLSSEIYEQEVVVKYCLLHRIPIVHIPNEGKRNVAYAVMLKRIGLQKGFPDLFITRASRGFHGLFIEMKYGKGKPTKEQNEWLELLALEGYACAICYDADEAIKIIKKYHNGGENESRKTI